jgi:hypothetical protein
LLLGLRHRAAQARQRPSPVGSLLDFMVWLLRHGLSPKRSRLFWLALFGAIAGAVALVFLPYKIFIAFGLVAAFGLLTVSLVLSYSRAQIAGRMAELGSLRVELNRAVMATHALRKDLQTGLDGLGQRIDAGLSEEHRSLSAKLTAQREALDARMDQFDGLLLQASRENSRRLDQQQDDLLARVREHMQEHRTHVLEEMQSLERQVTQLADDSSESSQAIRKGLMEMAARFDAKTAEIRSLDNRVEEISISSDHTRQFTRQQISTMERELSAFTLDQERQSGNDARLLEHIEQTIGDLQNRIAALEEAEARSKAATSDTPQ